MLFRTMLQWLESDTWCPRRDATGGPCAVAAPMPAGRRSECLWKWIADPGTLRAGFRTRDRAMRDHAYAAFSALDPFFDIVRQGLAGLVDGDHYFDTIAPDAVFEFRYRFPGWATKLVGREALMALYAGYGEGMALHRADALVVNISQTPGVVILEYEVQGNAVSSGKLYENRFISVVTIQDRKIVGWRDYMDSLAAMSSLTYERFQAKWKPVRIKKPRQIKNLEPRFDSI